MARKNNNHLTRPSYFEISNHVLDDIKNYGYKYEGNLFKKSVSNLYFQDAKKDLIFRYFDGMLSYVINRVKLIKIWRNYAMDRRYTKLR